MDLLKRRKIYNRLQKWRQYIFSIILSWLQFRQILLYFLNRSNYRKVTIEKYLRNSKNFCHIALESNMKNIFLSFSCFAISFTSVQKNKIREKKEITAKYEKQGRYLSCCSGLLCNKQFIATNKTNLTLVSSSVTLSL